MACRESRDTRVLLVVGLFLFASSFCLCTRLTKLKELVELKGNLMLSQGHHKGSELCRGRLLIGQKSLQGAKLKGTKTTKNLLDADTDYQADMGWGQPKPATGWDNGFSRLRSDDATVERLLKMEPNVECTGNSMKLQVQNAASTPGSLLFVDRGRHLSPLPLSKLPISCGYTIRLTRRDLVLSVPYDGCFVDLQEDNYILPLRWLGLPVKMLCPMRQSSPNPPMVTCHAEGMVVKVEWTISVSKIKVNLNGTWEPLMKASPRCGFSVVVHPEGVVVSVRYTPCLEKKDGMYTLELAGDGETKVSCPFLSLAQPQPIKRPKIPVSVDSLGQIYQQPQGQVYQPFYPQTDSQPATQPTAVPKPPQPEAPQDQLYQPFYLNPFYPQLEPEPQPQQPEDPQGQEYQPFYPETDSQPATQPTAVPKPPQPEAPQGKVDQPFYLNPFYPQLEPEPQPQQPEDPQGQEYQPFYPQTDSQPATQPTAVPKPPQPEAPQDQIYQPFYLNPFYPQLEPEPQPQQPEDPQGQEYQPFYPQTDSQPATQPTAVPKPPQPEAPQGKVYQPFYLNPFYPQLEPEPQPQQPEDPQGQEYQPFYPQTDSQPATQPTAVPKPPQPEAPQSKVYQPFYLNPFYPQLEPEPQPQQPEDPQGQEYQPFYPETDSQPATQPTAVPKPPQPEAPQDQIYQPFYPNPVYPQLVPEPQPATNPPQPQQPEAPQGQEYQPFYAQPDSQPATQPPQPEAPQGQVYEPFYAQPDSQPATQPPQPEAPQGQVYEPFYAQPDSQPATQPPQPEAPQGQVYEPFYAQPDSQPATQPPQPEAPQGQVYEPFYAQPDSQPATQPPQPEAPQGQVYEPFYAQPDSQPATQPPQPEAPQGQVYEPFYAQPDSQPATQPMAVPKPRQPFFPNLYYSQPEPEQLPAAKLPAVPKPPAREIPIGQIQKPSYPKPFKIPGDGTNGQTAPTEKPAQSEQPPAVKPPEGQVPRSFNPYYYPQQPQHPQPVTLPPATSMQQPQQVITPDPGQNTMESAKPQPSKSDMVTKNPLLGSAHMPPVYCPQSCPSGFSNCCPQIAFHQHLHHIVPAGPGSKDTPPIYAGLPFLPSVAYSGFGSGFGSAPFPQKPTEAVTTQAPTTSTSAPILPQSLPSGNEKLPYLQPLDGNPGALPRSNPSKPTNPKQTIYPYFVPNSLYPNWPYQLQSQELQNLRYIASPPHYGVPSTPQPLQQQNSKPSAEARSLLKRFLPLPPSEKGQNTSTAKELPPSNQKAIDYKGQTHPKVQSDLDHLVPYYMLQDAEATTYNKSTVLNNSTQTQPFVSDSKKSTRHEQGYVLLQHGPPGREPNSFHQSPLPVRDLVYDANFLAQSFARHHSSKPPNQDFRPPQQKTQHPKWLSKGMANPIPGNVNYMLRLGEESEDLPVLFSASDGSHFVPLPQDPTLNGAHLRPKFSNSFKDLWKPMTPLGSGIPPHVPGKAFQGWRSAADHEGKGLNQPIQKEGGNRK